MSIFLLRYDNFTGVTKLTNTDFREQFLDEGLLSSEKNQLETIFWYV